MMRQKASQDQLFYAFNLADHIPRVTTCCGVSIGSWIWVNCASIWPRSTATRAAPRSILNS